ncbi:MAG: helix-turn-helix domain-containing protein [Anaerolineae bacterium]|jgi:DNA-binding transcriptional ArsR family regulator|nr:helix-turn-helix domain-containing protein [Anaerolineae bacterium]
MLDETQAKPFIPAPELVISDLETLKVLADPLRLSILEYLMRPSTVKRIAEKIHKPATKLYYHFNLLEKHGLIVLVDTRIVSGIIEKHYQAAAKVYRVARDLLAPGTSDFDEGLELTLNGMFQATKQEILDNIHDQTIDMGENSPWHRRMTISQARLALTTEQFERFRAELQALIDKAQSWTDGNDLAGGQTAVMKMLYVTYPIQRAIEDETPEIPLAASEKRRK